MFANKHVIIAMLVAPVLAVLAWFAVDAFVGEQPEQAVPGQSYPLVARSNCRYDSGQCELRNEDFRLTITYENLHSGPALLLGSSHALESAMVGIAVDGVESTPLIMRRSDNLGQQWVLSLEGVPASEQRLFVVVGAAGSLWFADVSSAFLERYRGSSPDE